MFESTMGIKPTNSNKKTPPYFYGFLNPALSKPRTRSSVWRFHLSVVLLDKASAISDL